MTTSKLSRSVLIAIANNINSRQLDYTLLNDGSNCYVQADSDGIYLYDEHDERRYPSIMSTWEH